MEAYKELGKQLLNIGVAVIVFVIIQPFVSEKADIRLVVIGFSIYLIITISGFILIRFAEKNEKEKKDE